MAGKDILCDFRWKAGFIALSLALTQFTPVWAESPLLPFTLTDADVINALEKAKILAPTIRINARIGTDEVMVATYKNPKAEDKDCKIDAVLIAKTVMDLAPNQIPRVTVYFYSSSTLSKYKEVAVTAGDVKAFASGSLSKEELIASIKIKEDSISDPKRRIDEYLQEYQSTKKHKISTSLKGEEVLVTTDLDNTLSERNLKFEGLKLAEQAFEAAPTEAKKVVVTFEDINENSVISFSREEIKAIDETISSRFKEVKVEKIKNEGKFGSSEAVGKIDLDKIAVKDGPLKEERVKLVERLRGLQKAGVGFGPSPLEQLGDIEAHVHSESETVLQEKITKLSELIAKFEENLKGAKEHKAVGAAKPATAASAVTTGASSSAAPVEADLKRKILDNPDLYVSNMARDMIVISAVTHKPVGKYKTAEEHPNFRRILQSVIDTLKGAGRQTEAEKFQAQLDAIKAKYGG